MASSSGSVLSPIDQNRVDRLWAECVTCGLASRQETWARGVAHLKGIWVEITPAREDALQDAGFRLGLYNTNAKTCRFYGWPMGTAV